MTGGEQRSVHVEPITRAGGSNSDITSDIGVPGIVSKREAVEVVLYGSFIIGLNPQCTLVVENLPRGLGASAPEFSVHVGDGSG